MCMFIVHGRAATAARMYTQGMIVDNDYISKEDMHTCVLVLVLQMGA